MPPNGTQSRKNALPHTVHEQCTQERVLGTWAVLLVLVAVVQVVWEVAVLLVAPVLVVVVVVVLVLVVAVASTLATLWVKRRGVVLK